MSLDCPALITVAEQSGFRKTGRTDEVDRLAHVERWNRPSQVRPEQTGWRSTVQNLNLNRDYTKADAPEMQAMLRLEFFTSRHASWDEQFNLYPIYRY